MRQVFKVHRETAFITERSQRYRLVAVLFKCLLKIQQVLPQRGVESD